MGCWIRREAWVTVLHAPAMVLAHHFCVAWVAQFSSGVLELACACRAYVSGSATGPTLQLVLALFLRERHTNTYVLALCRIKIWHQDESQNQWLVQDDWKVC